MTQFRRHHVRVLGTLGVGDLVEFERVIIKHWGVNVGGEEIVHLTVDDRSGNIGWVKKENFWSIAEQSTVKKNNNKDGKEGYKSYRKKRALSKLGPSFYNALTYNCEHFANWCRYGLCESAQADTVLEGGNLTEEEATVLGLIGTVCFRFMGSLSSSSSKSS